MQPLMVRALVGVFGLLVFVGASPGIVHRPSLRRVALSEVSRRGKNAHTHGSAVASARKALDEHDSKDSSQETEEQSAAATLTTEIPKVMAESQQVNGLMREVHTIQMQELGSSSKKDASLLVTKVSNVQKLLNHMYHHFRGAIQRVELNKEMHASYDKDLYAESKSAVMSLQAGLDRMETAKAQDVDARITQLDDMNQYLQAFCGRMRRRFQPRPAPATALLDQPVNAPPAAKSEKTQTAAKKGVAGAARAIHTAAPHAAAAKSAPVFGPEDLECQAMKERPESGVSLCHPKGSKPVNWLPPHFSKFAALSRPSNATSPDAGKTMESCNDATCSPVCALQLDVVVVLGYNAGSLNARDVAVSKEFFKLLLEHFSLSTSDGTMFGIVDVHKGTKKADVLSPLVQEKKDLVKAIEGWSPSLNGPAPPHASVEELQRSTLGMLKSSRSEATQSLLVIDTGMLRDEQEMSLATKVTKLATSFAVLGGQQLLKKEDPPEFADDAMDGNVVKTLVTMCPAVRLDLGLKCGRMRWGEQQSMSEGTSPGATKMTV